MIIGDPYKFAICAQIIEEWNYNDYYGNGVLLYFVDGSVLPTEAENVDVERVISNFTDLLSNITEDEKLFSMEKDEAVKVLRHLTFPSSIEFDNDFRFIVFLDEIMDRGYYLFVVRHEDRVRFLATNRLEYDIKESKLLFDNMKVYETILSIEEVHELVAEFEEFGAELHKRWSSADK